MTDAELDVLFERRFAYQKAHAATNMREIVALAQEYKIPLASHDDTTEENVVDAVRDRVSVAEFPTTMEAARGLHAAGIDILMGAPNVVRGGSHSGNIAAVDLAREGLLDILSSDYIPSSLLMAALQLPRHVPAIDLASAVRTVTKTPAEAVGLVRSRRDRDWKTRRSDSRACRARSSRGAQRLAARSAGGMTEAATMVRDTPTTIGPGRLILVVGPSGAGKDTLLSLARTACAEDRNVVFARRVITRPSSAAEDNEEVSAEAFSDALARGDFAMHWEAHGHRYALPRAIDDSSAPAAPSSPTPPAPWLPRLVPPMPTSSWSRSPRRRTCWPKGWRCGGGSATARSSTGSAAPSTKPRRRPTSPS